MLEINDLVNKAIVGDCLSILREMPSESVDLVITDPPYGINFHSNMRKKSELKTVRGIANDGSDNTDFLEEVINELARIMKPDTHIYWFTRWDRVPLQMPLLSRYFTVKNALVWVKNGHSMGDLKGAYAGQYEVILFAQKGRRFLNEVNGKQRHTDILNFDRVHNLKLRHSHEKPEPLIEFLIRKSSVEGEIILDPFCGSGTTAAVAARLGRRFITMDLDSSLVETANKRIEEAKQLAEVKL